MEALDAGGVRIAYFFFPLPEPLRLPSGFVVESVAPVTVGEIRRHHGPEPDESSHEDFFAGRMVASTRVWQSDLPNTPYFELMVSASLDVAAKAIPTRSDQVGGSAEQPTFQLPQTVVEVAVYCDSFEDEELAAAFDQAIASVQTIQRAHYLATKAPLTLVSHENVPPVIPMALRDASETTDGWPDELHLYTPNANVDTIVRDEGLDDSEMEAFHTALGIADIAPFSPVSELISDGRHALLRRGDYRAAVTLMYGASEVLLDTLLMHMLWQEHLRPEDAAASYFVGTGLQKRLRTYYHPRLGGDWALDQQGPLATWNRDLAGVRHRVIHAGYRPSREEGYAAQDAARVLEDFIVTRVCQRRFVKRYPRTALALMGRPGLEAHRRWTRQIRKLAEDPNEPNWHETFARWKLVLNSVRRDDEPVQAAPEEIVTVMLLKTDGDPTWWLHDTVNRRVRSCSEPPDLTTQNRQLLKQKATEFLAQARSGERATLAWFGRNGEPHPNESWRHQHEVLPFHGVMLNGSDYR